MKEYLKVRKTKKLLRLLNCRFHFEGEDVKSIPEGANYELERILHLLLKRLVNAEDCTSYGVTWNEIEMVGITLDESLSNPDNILSEIYFFWNSLGYDFVVTQDDKWLYFFPYYPDTKTYALKAQEI